MSHLHIPDGMLTLWFVLCSWGILCPVVWLLLRRHTDRDTISLGITVPLTIAVMSIPLPVHINLMSLIGILVGPRIGMLTAILSPAILALFGHGGLGAMPLSALLLGIEAILGWQLFWIFHYLFAARKPDMQIQMAASCAAFITLVCTAVLSLLALLAIMHFGTFSTHSAHDVPSLRLAATFLPFALFAWVLESLLAGFAVLYIYRIRPSLILRTNKKATI